MNILGKRSDLPFSRKSDRKKEKSTVSFTHEQNIICSQTQLDGIAHEQTIICRQLFAGHVMGSRPMKRKKNLLRMIIALFNIHSNSNYFSVLNKITSTGTFFKTLAYFSARFQNIKQMGFLQIPSIEQYVLRISVFLYFFR